MSNSAESASPGFEVLQAGEERYSDTTNADALIAAFGDRIRYVKGWGWVAYDGKRWVRDAADEVLEFAKTTVRQMFWQAAQIESKYERDGLLRHANASLSYPRLRAMVELAKPDPHVRASVENFDRDPWLLNCQNGTVDLRDGTLRAHDPADLITQITHCDYMPEATSALWSDFVLWVADGREDLRDYLQIALGYSITGQTDEKGFFLGYGPSGDNGKSTLLEAVLYAVGDYGTTAETDAVLSKAGGSGGIPNDLAALAGKRYVLAAEPMEGRQFRMDRIKRLTGKDTISARFLNKEFFTFKPVLKLWLSTNSLPNVPESGNAAWRRVKLIPFDAHKPKEEQDGQLGEKFEAAAEAILAWLVQGCLRWQQEGLKEPVCMREAQEEYRNDQDPFVAFVAARCVEDQDAWTASTDLAAAYENWFLTTYRKDGEMTSNRFNALAEKNGFKKKRRGSGMGIVGLRLEADASTANTQPRPDEEEDDLPFDAAPKAPEDDDDSIPF